jgi:hypothetical protein
MLSPSLVSRLLSISLLGPVVVATACSINVKDKNKDGEARVDIRTPLGDVHVNEQPDVKETGLAVYPGAQPAPKAGSDEKKSANVNISTPGFTLKVVAVEFQSADAPDKVLAFYHKELQHFGKPIECHGHWTDGGDVDVKPGKKDGSKPVSCKSDSGGDKVELKVGTEENQHIVAVKPEGDGTRFALVYVLARTGSEDAI